MADTLSRPPGADRGEEDNQNVVVIPEHRINTIMVPNVREVKRAIMVEMHDHPTAGHPGRDETLRRTKAKYQWPGMKEWIADYVKGCAICQQSKINTHPHKTPLYRIPTTEDTLPFQTIAMDLITGLPASRGNDAILTIIDHGCSRAAIFIPCQTTVTGPGIAQLYLQYVYPWYGIPTKVISDRDPQFTSHFGRALAKLLGIKQNLSTAFHPQTDGLSERKNQWIEQYLRIVTMAEPTKWSIWLPIATAVHNNRNNTTLGCSPNQVLMGFEPRLMGNEGSTTNERANQRARDMTHFRRLATEAINHKANQIPPAQYHPREKVWLKATHLKLPY